jgi:hypothetical protein
MSAWRIYTTKTVAAQGADSGVVNGSVGPRVADPPTDSCALTRSHMGAASRVCEAPLASKPDHGRQVLPPPNTHRDGSRTMAGSPKGGATIAHLRDCLGSEHPNEPTIIAAVSPTIPQRNYADRHATKMGAPKQILSKKSAYTNAWL